MQRPNHVIEARPMRAAGTHRLAANDPQTRRPLSAAEEFHRANDHRALQLQIAAQMRSEVRS